MKELLILTPLAIVLGTTAIAGAGNGASSLADEDAGRAVKVSNDRDSDAGPFLLAEDDGHDDDRDDGGDDEEEDDDDDDADHDHQDEGDDDDARRPPADPEPSK